MALSIKQNFSLKKYNTFGVEINARYFVKITSEGELSTLFTEYRDLLQQHPVLVLGGGSNILFTGDFSGLVVHIAIPGIDHQIDGSAVCVVAGAGTVWNDLVWYCVDRQFGGIENMVLIPGTVGAAPVQNIGAYGAELVDVFHQCRAFDTQTGEIITFDKSDCGFSYRDSRFKKEKGRYIITQLTLNLSLNPTLNMSYGAIQTELQNRSIQNPTITDIAEVVSAIRTNKLPDPSTIGNAGSFFKNPIVSVAFLGQLQSTFPDMEIIYYQVDENSVKIAGGWLIEQCGWKGRKIGDAGTWKNQALVLVNHKNASGSELYDLSERIINDVKGKFGITLEREVNII